MNYLGFIFSIFEPLVAPIITLLSLFLINFIRVQTDRLKSVSKNERIDKYLDIVKDTISRAINYTNQTFVDALKNENKFDKHAWEKAFEITKTNVIAMLSEETTSILNDIYGDIDVWIDNMIESLIRESKS